MGLSQSGSNSSGGSLSQAVVEAVAQREDVDVTEIEPPEYEPLYTVVDPEALDALFSSTTGGATRPVGSVTFTYAGYDVRVHSDGEIELSQ